MARVEEGATGVTWPQRENEYPGNVTLNATLYILLRGDSAGHVFCLIYAIPGVQKKGQKGETTDGLALYRLVDLQAYIGRFTGQTNSITF